MYSSDILIVGGGIFGLTAAIELKTRGRKVRLLDAGPLPHPLAASTDISKVIRMEYGPDELYMEIMEQALAGWRLWNGRLREDGLPPLFHETGVIMACQGPMCPGGFEYEGFRLLRKRGHIPERLDRVTLASRFPAWNAELYTDGFYHAQGGYAESGRVIEALARQAQREGVLVNTPHAMFELLEEGERVTGVRDRNGVDFLADHVVLATGAWTGKVFPVLSDAIQPTGQPVFHLKPSRPENFMPGLFPTFTADIARTGYYGFPLHRDGVVKIASHGIGVRIDPDAPREVTAQDHERLRRFLKQTFPSLVEAEVVYTRLCLYSDTRDGNFWISGDPSRQGLTVAGGGSGHGFKFGPVLGPLIADAVEQRANPWLNRFRWRPDLPRTGNREAARYQGE